MIFGQPGQLFLRETDLSSLTDVFLKVRYEPSDLRFDISIDGLADARK